MRKDFCFDIHLFNIASIFLWSFVKQTIISPLYGLSTIFKNQLDKLVILATWKAEAGKIKVWDQQGGAGGSLQDPISVVHICHPSDGKKHKIGGSWSRPVRQKGPEVWLKQ
jgi:hypothetical protein